MPPGRPVPGAAACPWRPEQQARLFCALLKGHRRLCACLPWRCSGRQVRDDHGPSQNNDTLLALLWVLQYTGGTEHTGGSSEGLCARAS